MVPAAVIDPQAGRPQLVPGGRAAVRHHVGPLLQQRLDEPLRLAVGPWGVGPGLLGLQSHGQARVSSAVRLVGRAVVAEHQAALNPLAVEPGHRLAQEAHRGGPLLVGQDLDIRQTGGVIHRHVNLLLVSADHEVGRSAICALAGGVSAGDPGVNAQGSGDVFGSDLSESAPALGLLKIDDLSSMALAAAALAHRPEGEPLGNPEKGAEGINSPTRPFRA